jgi:hypothetical protein
MSDDGPDAIGKNFASYLETEGLPSNDQLADWLRSAFTAAQGELISISPLAASLIAERLDGGSSRRGPGRPEKIGEKPYEEDMDLLYSFWGFREQFENNNEPAPAERAYKAVADLRGIKVGSVKQALNRARKRTGHSLRVPRVPGR